MIIAAIIGYVLGFFCGMVLICAVVAGRDDNQLAEEYKDNYVHTETLKQVMWERDIAISQLKELGYGFGEKIVEGHNNDVCEWSKQGGYNFYLHKTSCGTEDTFDDSYKYCPYCGKKIKIIE